MYTPGLLSMRIFPNIVTKVSTPYRTYSINILFFLAVAISSKNEKELNRKQFEGRRKQERKLVSEKEENVLSNTQ